MFGSLFGLCNKLICLTIVGSCNGLVCLALATRSRGPHVNGSRCLTLDNNSNNNFVVWNPSTRENITLSNPCTPDVRFINCFGYGFGYNSSSDDYKIVLIYSTNHTVMKRVAILSLKKRNCWTIVGSSEADEFMFNIKKATFLNGALHWYQNNDYILVFDLTKETFFHIPTEKSLYNYGAAALQGCLCYISTSDDSPHPEILVMKEYGTDKSWSEVLGSLGTEPQHHQIPRRWRNIDIDDPSDDDFAAALRYAEVTSAPKQPFCISTGDDGFALINHSYRFLWIRESGKSIKTIYTFGDFLEYSQAIAYVESLVFPANS